MSLLSPAKICVVMVLQTYILQPQRPITKCYRLTVWYIYAITFMATYCFEMTLICVKGNIDSM